jgi:hypothetical protein
LTRSGNYFFFAHDMLVGGCYNAFMKRQGDLLILAIACLPEGIKPKENLILAEGETTGHLHKLDGGEVFTKQDALYFRVADGCRVTLTHPEHQPLHFIPGTYEVIRQREYRPQGWRHVSD